MKKFIVHIMAHFPLFFAVIFATLVVRARYAFGDWPKLSGNDPWGLVNRAPRDILHDFFSYSAHISLTYLSLIPAFIGVLLTVYLLIRGRLSKSWLKFSEIGGCVFMVALLSFQSGRFLWWFLD